MVHVVDKQEAKPEARAATCCSTTARPATSARSPSPRRCSSASSTRTRSTSREIERFCTSKQVPYIQADVARPVRRADPARLPARRVPPLSASATMILAGLPFTTLLAIFGAAAVFATALYILKLRRRTVPVPFSKLWEKILRDKEATSLFSRLKRLLSLLVQLALLALLALRARRSARGRDAHQGAQPRRARRRERVDAGDRRRARRASAPRRSEVKKVIRGLGGSDRMLVAQMDAAITPLGPMSGDTSELERALDSIKATDARADFPRAPALRDRLAARARERRDRRRLRRRARRGASTPSGQGAPRRRRQAHVPADRRRARRATSASRRSRCAATRSTRAATR